MTKSNSPPLIAEQLLSESMGMLTPLVRFMVSHGVTYPQLAQALKQPFIDAAKQALAGQKQRVTDAAVSLRSGVHRKEVRLRSAVESTASAAPATSRRARSLAEQVFTRWLNDAPYRTLDGSPAVLPMTGIEPSFDSLTRSVTKDFSRRTLLNELVRLGRVREDGDRVVPISHSAAPGAAIGEMLVNYRSQLHDHLAAGAANIEAARAGQSPPFLEQSLYVNGVSAQSVEQLAQLGRQIWKNAFDQMVAGATQNMARDETASHSGRLRFGVYFYSEGGEP